ncbi:MAG TPA: VOC family protein [Bacteroidia bacterium]|jgi:predicted enzyme related to lactoylglutathione lyase
MPENIFLRLVYIYIGTNDYKTDFNYYKNILGARLVWEKTGFGAQVAAFDLCGEPYLLIADHIKAPAKRLIYAVKNIRDAKKVLESRGWKAEGEIFEVPDGPCLNFSDPSGNDHAIIEMKRGYMFGK